MLLVTLLISEVSLLFSLPHIKRTIYLWVWDLMRWLAWLSFGTGFGGLLGGCTDDKRVRNGISNGGNKRRVIPLVMKWIDVPNGVISYEWSKWRSSREIMLVDGLKAGSIRWKGI